MGLTTHVVCPNCGQDLGVTEWRPTCIRHNDPNAICGCPECVGFEPEASYDAPVVVIDIDGETF